MKLKIINLLFFIFLINSISFVIGGLCPRGIDSQYEEAKCDSDSYSIINPTLYIYNFYDYTNITCEPSPISAIYYLGQYQITLDYNTEYRITAFNPMCEEAQTFNQTTGNGPRLIVTQPKCLNQYAIIDFVEGNGTSNDGRTFEVGNDQVSLPHEILFKSQYQTYFAASRYSQVECYRDFYLYPGDSEKVPDFQVFSGYCGNDGRILVANAQDYSSIRLYNSSDHLMDPTSGNGNFEELPTGDYYIILISDECGTQRFELTVSNAPPSYTLELVDESCPKYPVYKIDVYGFVFSVYIDGSLTTSEFTVTNGQKVTIDIDMCGIYEIPLNDIRSYPPVEYTVSSNTFCEELVTLQYNTTQITDLKIEYVNTNIDQIYNVTMEQGSQFSFKAYDPSLFYYKLSSPSCYSESIQFTTAKREPHVIIKSKTNYCNELIDIIVTNWLDFDDDLYFNVPGQNQAIRSVNGVFSQVPNQQYQLFFQRKGWCNPDSIYINTQALDYYANVFVESELTLNPQCNSYNPTPGIVTTKIFDAFTNQPLIDVTDEITIFDEPPFQVSHSLRGINKLDSCVAVFNISYTVPRPVVTITLVKSPICIYDFGEISIVSSVEISEIIINGDSYDPSEVNSFSVRGGSNTIYFDFAYFCNYYNYETVYFVDSVFSDFRVEYELLPITNCVESYGGFSIKDYSKYSYLGMDGMQIVNGTTGYNYPSRTLGLSFSIQLGNSTQVCQGDIDIFIATSIEITSSYRVVQKPLCDGDDSGIVIIDSIKDKQGNEYSSGNYFTGLKAGNHILNVLYGNICSWNINVTVPLANVIITPELDLSGVSSCSGYGRYKLKYSDDLAAYTSTVGENRDPITKFYTYSRRDDYDLYLFYGSSCQQTVLIKSISPTLPKIKYSVTLNGDENCVSSLTTINIQVENFKDYETLKYGELSIDSDGYFSNVIPGGTIVGRLYTLDCDLNEEVIVSDPIIAYTAVNETCNEGYNGEVTIDDKDKKDYYYLLQNINNPDAIDYKSSHPILSSSNSYEFGLVGSKKLRLLKINKAHPSCVVSNDFELTSVEPELLVNVLDQCGTELGSVSILTNPSGLSATYELGDSSTPTPSPTTAPPLTLPPLVNGEDFILETASIEYTDTASNITAGNYSLTYTITSEFCKRKYFSYVNIPFTSSVNVSATSCQTIQFTPSNLTAIYYYKVFGPNQLSSELFNHTGLFNYSSFEESGAYILQVSTGSCIKNHTVQIEKCPSKSKSNIGLIVGLVIGLIALAAIIAVGVIYLKKKRDSSTKVNDVEGIQHELNTVKVYTGNKLQELDRF